MSIIFNETYILQYMNIPPYKNLLLHVIKTHIGKSKKAFQHQKCLYKLPPVLGHKTQLTRREGDCKHLLQSHCPSGMYGTLKSRLLLFIIIFIFFKVLQVNINLRIQSLDSSQKYIKLRKRSFQLIRNLFLLQYTEREYKY